MALTAQDSAPLQEEGMNGIPSDKPGKSSFSRIASTKKLKAKSSDAPAPKGLGAKLANLKNMKGNC